MNKLLAIFVAAFFTVVSIAPVSAIAEEESGDKASAAEQAPAADPAVADKEAENEKAPADAPASGDQ